MQLKIKYELGIFLIINVLKGNLVIVYIKYTLSFIIIVKVFCWKSIQRSVSRLHIRLKKNEYGIMAEYS